MTPRARWLIPLIVVLSLAAAGCSTAAGTSAAGTLSGRLTLEGPLPQDASATPVSGTVTFFHRGRVTAKVEVGADGRFSHALRPGTYQVTVCTSHVQQVNPNGSHLNDCQKPLSAMVRAGQTAAVAIPSFIVP